MYFVLLIPGILVLWFMAAVSGQGRSLLHALVTLNNDAHDWSSSNELRGGVCIWKRQLLQGWKENWKWAGNEVAQCSMSMIWIE
jgi:hypothetical protein